MRHPEPPANWTPEQKGKFHEICYLYDELIEDLRRETAQLRQENESLQRQKVILESKLGR